MKLKSTFNISKIDQSINIENTTVLVCLFIAMKRHWDHSNSYKEIILIEGGSLRVSVVQFIMTMMGNMVACRQTWY